MACAYTETKPGDAEGIISAYRYWTEKGHKAVVFIKRYRVHNSKNPKVIIENATKLEIEIPKSSIAYVPAKEDDDSYIIDYCMSKEAIAVSNDQFRDHADRFEGDAKEAFIQWRDAYRCGFTFVLGEFMPSPQFKPPKEKHVTTQPSTTDNELIPWLENEMKKPIALATLSQRIMGKYGGKSPRKAIREVGGISGRTLISQLKTMFGDRLDIREDGHVVCIIDKKTKGKSTSTQTNSEAHLGKMTEDLAVSTVLDIVGVPVSSRLVKPTTNVWFWLSWLRGSRKTKIYKTNYANVGHHFKELTGHKLKSVFSSPEDICQRIAKSYPSLTATVTPNPNNELVIVAAH